MYKTIDPDNPSEITLPEGMLVVKEHLDAEGQPSGYTMMYKGPPGTNADTEDWWFARVGADGNLKESGAPGFCVGCHSVAEETDWLFGVPLDNRS